MGQETQPRYACLRHRITRPEYDQMGGCVWCEEEDKLEWERQELFEQQLHDMGDYGYDEY